MKTKSLLSILALGIALTVTSAQAGLLVTYNNGTALGLFEETTGAKIRDFSTTLTNANAVTTDNAGNVYVGNGGLISMYNIATGNLVRDLGGAGYNAVRALTFNPTNPGQIVTIRNYGSGPTGELSSLFTNGTGTADFRPGTLGGNYTSLAYYSGDAALYASSNGGFVEAFLTTAGFPYAGVARSGLGTGAGGVTATSSELYYVSNSGGYVQTQITNTNIITGLNNPLGITNNGTNLFVANFGTDQVLAFTTAGSAVNALSFSVNDPTAVAWTAIPEPSTAAFVLLGGLGLIAGRRLNRRS